LHGNLLQWSGFGPNPQPELNPQFGTFAHTNHEQQLLQEVGTNATGPRTTFAKKLPQTKSAVEKADYELVDIIAYKRVEFVVGLYDVDTVVTTWSNADIDHIVCQLQREIYIITSKD